jgi:hypothetical protein
MATFNEVIFLLIVSRVLVVFMMGSAINVNLVLYSPMVVVYDLGVATLGGGTTVIVNATL